MSAHTKGPWEIHLGYDNTGYPCFYIHGMAGDQKRDIPVLTANAKLIAAAPDMLAILDELEGAFDKEIYPEQVREEFNALDDREYSVTITAKQWRALGRAIGKAQGAT